MPSLYSLGPSIGRGAYGDVYRCYFNQESGNQESGKAKLVMKKIGLDALSDAERCTALKEVKLLALLRHPCIVSMVDAFVEEEEKGGGTLCIVMEFCEKGDLSKLIQGAKERKKGFSEKEIVDWFTQIALAIKHCHMNKVLHRDLKSQNIYLTEGFLVKLGDFGIARVLETLELAQTVVGTPYTMSPEVCNSFPYSYKSDIWSLGCVLFELCELQYPFTGHTLLGVVWKIVKEEVPPITGNYSPELKNLVKFILNKDPDLRPSIDEVLNYPLIQSHISTLLRLAEKTPDVLSLSQERSLRRQSSRTLQPKVKKLEPLVVDSNLVLHESALKPPMQDFSKRSSDAGLTPKQIMQLKKEAKVREQEEIMSKAALDAKQNFAAAGLARERDQLSVISGIYPSKSSLGDMHKSAETRPISRDERPLSGYRVTSTESKSSESILSQRKNSFDERPFSAMKLSYGTPSSNSHVQLQMTPLSSSSKSTPLDRMHKDNLFGERNREEKPIKATGKYDFEKVNPSVFEKKIVISDDEYEDDFLPYETGKEETEVEAWCAVLKDQATQPVAASFKKSVAEERPLTIDPKQKMIAMKHSLLEQMTLSEFDQIYNYIKAHIDLNGVAKDMNKYDFAEKFGIVKLKQCQQVESYLFFEMQAANKFALK